MKNKTSFRDPRDVRRLLGAPLMAARAVRRAPRSRLPDEPAQLVLPGCGEMRVRCPTCATPLHGHARCWACEAFACALCDTWIEAAVARDSSLRCASCNDSISGAPYGL